MYKGFIVKKWLLQWDEAYTFIFLLIFYFREKAEKRHGHGKTKAGTKAQNSQDVVLAFFGCSSNQTLMLYLIPEIVSYEALYDVDNGHSLNSSELLL